MAIVYSLEQTPDMSNEIVSAIAQKIQAGAPPVKVKRSSRLRPLGNCYWNAAAAAKESGGEVELGWMIQWWPGAYGAAIHHAVWKMPSGQLLDITEPQPADTAAKYTIFVTDPRHQVDLQKPPCIDNIFVPISSDQAVGSYLSAYGRKEHVRRQMTEAAWEMGYRSEPNFAKAIGASANQVGIRQTRENEAAAMRYRDLLVWYQKYDLECGTCLTNLKAKFPGDAGV